MKCIAVLTLVMLAGTNLIGAAVNSRILALIGPKAWAVTGSDVDKYASSGLAQRFPWHPDAMPSKLNPLVHQFLSIWEHDADNPPAITVFCGAFSLSDFSLPEVAEPPQVGHYRGIPILSWGEEMKIALLEANTGIVGQADDVRTAIDRWLNQAAVDKQIDEKILHLSGEYDNWVLILEPFQHMQRSRPALPLKYGDKIVAIAQEIQMGLRVGSFNEIDVRITMDSSENAYGLAILAKWIPGLIELAASGDPDAAIIGLVENLTARAEGRVASLTFSIPESKIREHTNRSAAVVQ